ncbi:MAG: acetyl-CoA carboxylase biotin carboxyl carrier protein [Alphaproteobacteria bacterium]|nr:acetyl-CoA carboxylase biotin carboxyl carrier protein [Alphaproteobacteria bacterium]
MTRVPFDAEAIRTLAAILTETGLTEIEIAEKESRIRVARAPAPVAAYATAPAELAPVAASGGPVQTVPAITDLSQHPGAVLSPMVGVAYLSPEPGTPPYVTIGQTVEAGQTLMLIEAMKTFNQIKAPKSGVVAQILVVSGGPVEYGEVLMVLE